MKTRKILWAACVLLLVGLQLALNANAARLARQGAALGVTLSAPLTARQAADARTWEQGDANTAGVTASFWGEEKFAVTTNSGKTAADVRGIGFSGNAADCLAADYLQGTPPGPVGQQCAVSSALAWALFGSYDVTGLTVTAARTEFVICGVFKSDDSMLLYPGTDNFTHAALRGISADTPRESARQWAADAGAGVITALDYAPQKAWFARALCGLPGALVGVCLVVLVLRFAAGLPGIWRSIVCFALALAAAYLLPRYLQTLPAYLLPTRWSNFGFWEDLWKEIVTAVGAGHARPAAFP